MVGCDLAHKHKTWSERPAREYTPAYYEQSEVTAIKCFITLGPVGPNLVLNYTPSGHLYISHICGGLRPRARAEFSFF
jgi:hypothetical protein